MLFLSVFSLVIFYKDLRSDQVKFSCCTFTSTKKRADYRRSFDPGSDYKLFLTTNMLLFPLCAACKVELSGVVLLF